MQANIDRASSEDPAHPAAKTPEKEVKYYQSVDLSACVLELET